MAARTLNEDSHKASIAVSEQIKSPVRRRLLRQSIIAYAFLLPTFIFVGLFSYRPVVRALIGAFTAWNGLLPPTWVGLSNFIQLFHDPVFLESLVHIGWWSLIGIPLGMLAAFAAALMIYRLRSMRAQYWFRFLFVMTMAIPGIVGILIWVDFYNPGGAIDLLLNVVGLGRFGTAWLANPQTALWALILMGFPWVSAFALLIFYAGFQGIPTELVDAATVDGATSGQRVWRIEVPLLMPQIKLLIILSIVGISQNLLTPLLMTNGGPENASITPVLYMYQNAIDYDRFGYAMAIAFVIFLVSMTLAIVGMKYIRTGNEQEGNGV
ncbi:MAG: sugar ABC transporter permease [Sulfobacillus acidophilus]|uniref:Sugar ABC transporter permease n=1 Tax=Sulfobacillus acidophilus TaxID=53633 RepID=A0A2T2WHJ1_9FIRM|nr:MAG: sugar ABC transporter permease [Sulfobacillus acidophilus]